MSSLPSPTSDDFIATSAMVMYRSTALDRAVVSDERLTSCED